jgi:uncharacterized membrane protein YczE
MLGLWLFGTGEALIVQAGLGATPWTVLAQGAAEHLPLGVGLTTVLISLIVLALWVPLRQPPGLGTVANAVLVGLWIAVTLPLLPGGLGPGARAALLAGGIALVALGSGFYLTAALGPGPRDGLMTGLHRRTGRSLRLLRTLIEGTALVVGVLLGGTAGIGTVAFAVAIGPGVQWAVGRIRPVSPGASRPRRAQPRRPPAGCA